MKSSEVFDGPPALIYDLLAQRVRLPWRLTRVREHELRLTYGTQEPITRTIQDERGNWTAEVSEGEPPATATIYMYPQNGDRETLVRVTADDDAWSIIKEGWTHLRAALDEQAQTTQSDARAFPDMPEPNIEGWPAVFDWEKKYGRLAGITTDAELARKLGLSHSHVRKMRQEHGAPRRSQKKTPQS